jgi:hypothetical protein
MRFVTAGLLWIVAVSTGCGRSGPADSTPISAERIFTDPQQLRLAKAVDRGSSTDISDAIRRGADVDAPGRAGIRMLMWAMIAGSVEGFNALLDRDANLMAHYFNPDGMRPGQKTQTVAEYVCVFADKRFLEAMLARGLDPNRIVDHDARETMLFYAVFRHDIEAVSRLIDAGANVNFQNATDRIPLALAVSIGDFAIALHLYSKGGDPLIKDHTGYNVIDSLKLYGSRGATPEQKPYFDEFVAALESRGLITKNDIVEADKPRGLGRPGVTIIEHPPGSATGRAIKQMENMEQDLNRRLNR